MLVNEARDAFDLYDDDDTMTVSTTTLPLVLTHLGFDLEREEVEGLVRRHVEEKGSGEVTLVDFMRIFAELDKADTGLEIY